MKRIQESFLHVATLVGYMWAGWLTATEERWYWIIAVIALTAIVHMSAIGVSIKNNQEDK